jgi:hypothetical protein
MMTLARKADLRKIKLVCGNWRLPVADLHGERLILRKPVLVHPAIVDACKKINREIR